MRARASTFFPAVALLLLLSSCVPHRAYVASSFEPLVITKKREVQGSIGLRPFKYYYADFTYAASDNLALRLTAGGFFGLGNLTGSALYYKNTKHGNFYTGALFNFQSNEIHRRTPSLLFDGNIYNDYGYSCRYLSPGAVMGASINDRSISHHFIIKLNYSIVDKYDYYLKRGVSGLSGYSNKTLSNESLNNTLPPFISIEPSYALLFKDADKRVVKIQAGLNLCQISFVHSYMYNDESYSPNTIYAKTAHPVSRWLNISIGYIFYSKK